MLLGTLSKLHLLWLERRFWIRWPIQTVTTFPVWKLGHHLASISTHLRSTRQSIWNQGQAHKSEGASSPAYPSKVPRTRLWRADAANLGGAWECTFSQAPRGYPYAQASLGSVGVDQLYSLTPGSLYDTSTSKSHFIIASIRLALKFNNNAYLFSCNLSSNNTIWVAPV